VVPKIENEERKNSNKKEKKSIKAPTKHYNNCF
jgi:hypothetical protein